MKKKHIITLFLIITLLIGLSLLLYPTFSDYWNSFHQSSAIASYMEQVTAMDDNVYEKMWDSAEAYNRRIAETGNIWEPDQEMLKEYNQQLNVTDTGIMGYVEIPVINCRLPVYHGTDETVLQIAVGHIEGSSLPVGGPDTHCVLSGHRGLPSAMLFTDLDKLTEGDIFMLQVLDETLTYEVERIRIVKPYEVDSLKIEPGRDLCTLVTCTPYGINTHRILVQGKRIETREDQSVRVTADAVQVEPLVVAPIVAVFPLLILLIVLLISTGKRKRAKRR